MRFLRLENTPEGRVASLLVLRDEEQMKMKMRQGERNGMRDKPGYQDLQKHLKEGMRDCCNQGKWENDEKVCEDGTKKK